MSGLLMNEKNNLSARLFAELFAKYSDVGSTMVIKMIVGTAGHDAQRMPHSLGEIAAASIIVSSLVEKSLHIGCIQ